MKTLKQYIADKKVSAALILTDGNVILGGRATGLILPNGKPKWDLPKGGVDKNESPLQTVIRETREETSLRIKPTDVVDRGMFHFSNMKDLHIFLMKVEKLPAIGKMKCTSYFMNDEGKKTLEIDKHKYIKIKDMKRYFQDNLINAINKAMNEG